MKNLFVEAIESNYDYKKDKNHFEKLENKTDVESKQVDRACDFFNAYFNRNFRNGIGETPANIPFCNGGCAYFAIMLRMCFPKGYVYTLEDGTHAVFVINTSDKGVLVYDSSCTERLENVKLKFLFSLEDEFEFFKSGSHKEWEMMCLKAVKDWKIRFNELYGVKEVKGKQTKRGEIMGNHEFTMLDLQIIEKQILRYKRVYEPGFGLAVEYVRYCLDKGIEYSLEGLEEYINNKQIEGTNENSVKSIKEAKVNCRKRIK